MLQRAFRSHLYPFIRDICCYSLHASLNKAAKQGFHKLGEGGGPDHGSLPCSRQVLTFMALWILCERDGFRGNFQETVGDKQEIIN